MMGIISVLLVAANILWLAKRYKEIAWAIVIAFIFRISAALINTYVVTLPDGGIDAYGFEWYAWDWGKDGLVVAISKFFILGASWVYSNIASVIYAIFGRDQLMLQSISVLAGVYCVVLAWKLSLQVWSSKSTAKTSAWLVAIYPILILYSALTMREVFITLLMLYGMIYVVLWTKTNKIMYALIALMAFFLQVLLHPGIATAGVLFLGIVFFYNIKISYTSLITNSKLDLQSSIIITFCSLCLFFGVYFIINASSLPFSYNSWLQLDNLISRASVMYAGVAAYPSWLIAQSPMEFLLLLVPKFLYFLFSPFPWDISKVKHIIGLLDGLFYMLLFISIYFHRKYIMSNPQALILILFIIFLSLIFSIAVGNFGTGLRHRSKLLPVIIIVAAPFVYRVLFSKRKN